MMGDVHIAMDAGDDHLTGDKQHWVNYTYYVKLRKGSLARGYGRGMEAYHPYADDDSVMLVSVRDILLGRVGVRWCRAGLEERFGRAVRYRDTDRGDCIHQLR